MQRGIWRKEATPKTLERQGGLPVSFSCSSSSVHLKSDADGRLGFLVRLVSLTDFSVMNQPRDRL